MHALYTGGVLGVLLGKYAKHTCSDLVMDGRFVVLANNVNAEFLGRVE